MDELYDITGEDILLDDEVDQYSDAVEDIIDDEDGEELDKIANISYEDIDEYEAEEDDEYIYGEEPEEYTYDADENNDIDEDIDEIESAIEYDDVYEEE